LYSSIPNFITLARVMSVPVIFWLLVNGHSRAAFFVFLAAGISDAVDGYLAKRLNWRSELGAYLDPLADKLLIVSIYIALAARGDLLLAGDASAATWIPFAVPISWLMDQPVRTWPPLATSATIRCGHDRPRRRRLRPRPRHDAARAGVDYRRADHSFAHRLCQGLASAHERL
jgi:hypothetical protein